MDLLLPGADFLCAGALGESNRLHAPGCIVPDSLVAEKADHNASSHSDCSFCCAWDGHGVTRNLVGTLPSGNEPRRFYIPQSDRANPRGEPRCLVLPEQNLLAVQSDLYLSEMEHFTGDLLDYIWLIAGIAACVAIYFIRRYVGRSVEVAAAFFVATLSPVLGFIMLFTFRYTFVADHYQYLACIGPIALASAGIVSLSDKFAQYRAVIVSAALLVVASLGSLDVAASRDVRRY